MCDLNTEFGEQSWMPCCKTCGIGDVSPISKLCKSCRSKDFYQRNKITILQKAKERYKLPEFKAKRAELTKKYSNRPEVKEKRSLNNLEYSRRPNYRFNKAKLRATAKNIEWKLTKQAYITLIQMECWYCDGNFQKQKDQTGIGLDRIDNNKGYEPGNVVSCCGACNLTRQNRWTTQQAKVMIQAVIEYNKLYNIAPPQSTIEKLENV